jgi:putative ABC transport system substrate-binding protein
MNFRTIVIMAFLFATRIANGAGVLTVGDPRVAQYREALGAAKEILRDGPVLDPNASNATERLKQADPAVILAVGQKALQFARQNAPTVPTVFCMVLTGTGTSRTVTGVRLEVAAGVQLSQLRQAAPQVKRIGVIYDPHVSAGFVEEAVKAAGVHGVTVVSRPVSDPREVRGALNEIAGSIDGLWLVPDPHLVTVEMFNYLLVFTLEHKIALFGFLESFTQAGALASVSPDYQEIGRRAAKMAADVAARPDSGRVPVPPPIGSPGVLTLNAKTARRLGLEFSPAALSKAHQVYR